MCLSPPEISLHERIGIDMALELVSVNDVQVPAKVVKQTASQKETRKMIDELIAAGPDVVGKIAITVSEDGKTTNARSIKMGFIHGFKAATDETLKPKMWESTDGGTLFIQVVKNEKKADSEATATAKK